MEPKQRTRGQKLASFLADLCVVAGGAVGGYGVWLISPAYGFISGGLFLVVFGVLAGVRADR